MTKNKKTNIQTRKVAIQLYAAIIERKLSLSGLTNPKNGANAYINLEKSEQNFVKAILTCTLRHKITIEHLLQQYLKNDLPNGARTLRHILHISITQLLYLNISNYAAINIAVDLAKYDSRTKRFAKLVNAILREIDRDIEKDAIKSKLIINALETVPIWFKDLLIKDYGEEKAEQIIIAQNNHQSIDLTVKNNVDLWAREFNANRLWGNSLRLPSDYKDEITKLKGYQEGEWWVQDCSAYLPVNFIQDNPNIKIADLCAAPGGKTAQLCTRFSNVSAFEINPNRFNRLENNLKRLNIKANLILGNFIEKTKENEFDAVLLDAPCSSTGTIRKNIDILWSKDFSDIESLSNLQYDLLKQAIKCTKIGGHIIFSNCSLAKLEGEELIEKLLNEQDNVELCPIEITEDFLQNNPKLKQFITQKGFFRITPDDFNKTTSYIGAMDGFFIARLRKIA